MLSKAKKAKIVGGNGVVSNMLAGGDSTSSRKWMETKHSNPDWEEVGMPKKLGDSPLEKITPMYPTPKAQKRTPYSYMEHKRYLSPELRKKRDMKLRELEQREHKPQTVETGKQRYNAYLKKKGLTRGMVK